MLTPKRLFAPVQLSAAAATYYTAPANTRCIIRKLTCNNPTVVAYQVTIYLIVAAGAASDTNTITKTRTVAPKETAEFFEVEGHIMEAGDFLQAFADTAAKVNLMGSGIEIT